MEQYKRKMTVVWSKSISKSRMQKGNMKKKYKYGSLKFPEEIVSVQMKNNNLIINEKWKMVGGDKKPFRYETIDKDEVKDFHERLLKIELDRKK